MRKFLLIIVLTFFVNSCTTRYVPVERVQMDSVRVVDVQRDSIYILDSVIVEGRNDTVYLTRWRVEYREALRVDTLIVQRTDTLKSVVEVEREPTRLEALKMDIGTGVLWAVPIMIGLYVLYRRFLK